MLQLLEKYKNHALAKYIVAIFIVFLVYLTYETFIWVNTESTDNAYIDTDISSVSSEIKGVLKNVYIAENAKVNQGDLIAEIDDSDFKASLASIEASINETAKNIEVIEEKSLIANMLLEQAKEKLAYANTNLEITTTDYNRIKELSKDKYASKKEFDQSKVALSQATKEFKNAELDMQIAVRNLRLLDLQKSAEEQKLAGLIADQKISARSLVNTRIIAPISGVLANSSSSLQVGNYITPGRILFVIVQDQKLYIKANFKETQVTKFRVGDKVKLEFDSLPKLVVYGKIRSLFPATGSTFSLMPTDTSIGNFTKIVQRVPVIIDFDPQENIDSRLVAGMSVEVSVRTDQKRK